MTERKFAELIDDEKKARELAEIAKAVAHPLRLRILACLGERGIRSVTDLSERLGASQAIVSQHLRILRGQRLVTNVRDGKTVHYGLSRECLKELVQYINDCSE